MFTVRNLYSEADLQSVRGSLKKRLIVLGVAAGIVFAVFVYSLIIDDHKEFRPEWLSLVSGLLCAAVLIFGWDVFCRPLHAYAKHIDSALHGRSHDIVLEFDHVDEDVSVVSGIPCLTVFFLGEADKHGERSRMFYWDRELALPDLAAGESVTVRYYDKHIIGIGH